MRKTLYKIMSKNKISFIIILILCIIISFGLFWFLFQTPTTTLKFRVSDKTLDNPSRGFYVQIDSGEEERIKEIREAGVRLILLAYDLHDYIDRPISDEKLQELENTLEEAKEQNVKVIFRAAYRFSENYKDPESITLVQEHIKQISSILNSYEQNILCVQAGFLGPWGEWHGSEYLEGTREDNDRVRNTVIKSLLDNLNSSVILNVRRPKFIRVAKSAGLDVSRIGFHNDALMSSVDDLGTYDEEGYSREEELSWADQYIQTGINGGEMPMISEYTSIDNAVKELEQLNITYLNLMYNQEVLEQWKEETYKGQNAYEFVQNHLGYRYSLDRVEVPEYIRTRRAIHVEGKIKNTGFASISKEYQFYFVISREHEMYITKLENLSQERDIINFQVDFTLPKEIIKEEGTAFSLGLMLTDDPSDELSSSCVQFANEEVLYEQGINHFAEYEYYKGKYIIKK